MPSQASSVAKYPDASIVVHSLGSDSWENVPLYSIRSVSPPDDEGSIEVIYSVTITFPHGRQVQELRVGESTIERLFMALGWHSDEGAHYNAAGALPH